MEQEKARITVVFRNEPEYTGHLVYDIKPSEAGDSSIEADIDVGCRVLRDKRRIDGCSYFYTRSRTNICCSACMMDACNNCADRTGSVIDSEWYCDACTEERVNRRSSSDEESDNVRQ